MGSRLLRGTITAPGLATGPLWHRPQTAADHPGPHVHHVPVAPRHREAQRGAAMAALAAAGDELERVAAGLPEEEAAIVRAGVLMAADPMLVAAVEAGVLEDGLTAAAAIDAAAARQADAIASIDEPTLAARADDVRSLGRRAARLAQGGRIDAAMAVGAVVVAGDLGPADVAELAEHCAGIALAAGGATAHAAIVARSLGLPMVSGLGAGLLAEGDGTPAVLDGDEGRVVLEPGPALAGRARAAMAARRGDRARASAERDVPATTTDGHRVAVLANVASTAELELALRAGAEGVGLLRTELAFLGATRWPSESEHRRALEPILAGLGGRPGVVRVLDFGGDKLPPFLRATRERGIALLLAHPAALMHQLRAILLAAPGRDVRLLLPLVERPDQVARVRELAARCATELGWEAPPVIGAMVETPGAARAARQLAAVSDFLSIGTNDLTASALGADRFTANDACPHDPRVLSLIARTVSAAHEYGVSVEVCGEAASDATMLPLLIGLDVDEVSVGAARVGVVRRWVRELEHVRCRELAGAALRMRGPQDVAGAVEPIARALRSAEIGDVAGQRGHRESGVVAFGA